MLCFTEHRSGQWSAHCGLASLKALFPFPAVVLLLRKDAWVVQHDHGHLSKAA